MLRFAAPAIAGLLLLAAPAQAQVGADARAAKSGFSLPATGPVKILVFRPDVQVGSQSTGGMNEPNAEWTETARKELARALEAAQKQRSNELVVVPDLDGEQGALLAEYRSLFKVVTGAVVQHKLFAGNRLPTKKETFNWTLGQGASKLAALGGDYGLFIHTNDSYGSAGRKAAQLVGAMFGAYIPSGVHVGYAGLVDLKTGELVWVNADTAMGGDVREADGAAKRVEQLLRGFPTRAGAGGAVKEVK
jgi:hypothetical protein